MHKKCSNSDPLSVCLLTPEEMGRADRHAIDHGTPGRTLMEAAGQAVAAVAGEMIAPGSRVCVLAGPGNNGGDGFVAARHLADGGHAVRIVLLGETEKLTGDAAGAARGWTGPVEPLAADSDLDCDLVVDALFGAGLGRDLDGPVAALVARLNATAVPAQAGAASADVDSGTEPGCRSDAGAGPQVLAVDLPSGIDGETGAVRGVAVRAAETVTFFRRKPGHLLCPGRNHCGRVHVRQIGIGDAALEAIGPQLWENRPAVWAGVAPAPDPKGHKYDRGHVVVVSGPAIRTGAARLAAGAALRAGAGLVTVASPPDALLVHAAHLTAVMIARMDGSEGLSALLADRRFNAVAVGPANGVGAETRARVLACLRSGAAVVADADALTSFAAEPEALFAAIGGRSAPVVLTPHEGEFRRLFADLADNPDKVARARAGAARAGATVLLKGADTVIAAPDGRAVINDNAPANLATAGAGDVLAGIVAGFLAQGWPAFAGAAAAAWVHGAAAAICGPGLTAEDLADALPAVFSGAGRPFSAPFGRPVTLPVNRDG